MTALVKKFAAISKIEKYLHCPVINKRFQPAICSTYIMVLGFGAGGGVGAVDGAGLTRAPGAGDVPVAFGVGVPKPGIGSKVIL